MAAAGIFGEHYLTKASSNPNRNYCYYKYLRHFNHCDDHEEYLKLEVSEFLPRKENVAGSKTSTQLQEHFARLEESSCYAPEGIK